MTATTKGGARSFAGWFSARQLRHLRESLTGYIFILPAFVIIGLFGLFPMLFSVYVSLHRWRIIPGDYLGLANYVRALNDLAYLAGLWLAFIFLYLAYRSVTHIVRESAQHKDHPWPMILPGLITAGGIVQFVRFSVLLLPEILDIGEIVKGMERTQELFLRLLGEAWRVPQVHSARVSTIIILAVGLGVAYLFTRTVSTGPRAASYYSRFTIAFLLVVCGIAVGWFTLDEIRSAYALAAEQGETLAIWPHVLKLSGATIALIVVWQITARLKFTDGARILLILGGLVLTGALQLTITLGQANLAQVLMILAGVVLLFLSWKTWHMAKDRETDLGILLWFASAILMMIAAWVLIGELPRLIQAGDRNWWQGLQATVYYSLFTVPVQLSIAMFLAVLLFQDIKGKGIFRVIYFLPYITNPVAAAGVFRVIFSSRVSAPMNSLLTAFGARPLLWLDEPMGIFQMILGPSVTLPQWLAGPSLALIVIVIFNIWNFAGYNTVVFLAGLGSIPGELYEAASIDGAGRWHQFRHITLPLISPTTYFLTLIAVIGTFKAFTHVWVLRSNAALGTTDTASIVIFNEFNRNTRYGYASSLALILLGFVLVLTLINNRIAEQKVFYG